MIFPQQLIPSGKTTVLLSSGRTVDLPVSYPVFQEWTGKFSGFDFGNKPLLDYRDNPVFAELLILKLFLEFGWDGVWVETYGGTNFLKEMPANWKLSPHHIEIPQEKELLLKNIWKTAKTNACFDVFVWKGADVLFCEAKYKGKDKFTKGQIKFIEGALRLGVPIDSFLIVEWTT